MQALLVSLPLLAAASIDTPPVFTDTTFEKGVEDAKAQGKIFVLDAMTSWHGPCKGMDRTTWVDPDLVAWMKENTIAAQLDMDEHAPVRDSLGIDAFPMIVAFKDGREFDRIVGLHDAEFVLGWLEGVRSGATNLDEVMSEVANIRMLNDVEVNCEKRAQLAGQLLAYGKNDEALAELLWLWKQIPETAPALKEYRWSTLKYRMESLAAAHTPAQAEFTTLRDALTVPAQDVIRRNNDLVRDWIELNSIVDDDALTVAWVKKMTEHGNGVRILRKQEARLFDMLIADDKWYEAGMVLNHPIQSLTAQGEQLGASLPAIPMTGGGDMTPAKKTDRPRTDAAIAEDVRARLAWHFVKRSGETYGALLAADRTPEAREVGKILLGHVDTPDARASLVAHALRAGKLDANREQHLAWLDEAWGR